MHVVTAVGDHQPQLMQACSPAEHACIIGIQLPAFLHLLQQRQCGVLHAVGLHRVDAIAMGEGGHRFIARVVVTGTAENVIEDALAHRRLADQQLLQAQRLEGGLQHQDAAGDDRAAIAGQAGQHDVVDLLGLQQLIAELGQRLGRDRALAQLHRRADLADGLVGA
ncbi:hypothetical protein D3C72_1211050 [compost metagenome]